MSKKIIYLLSLLMALSLVFASCKKTNGITGGDLPGDEPNNIKPPTEDLTGGLFTDKDKLDKWQDTAVQTSEIAKYKDKNYMRNPVITVVNGSTVVVFYEVRYQSPGSANDTALTGTNTVDIVYTVSTDAGVSFDTSTGINYVGGKKATGPSDSHGAPVVFYDKTNKKLVVVASAGIGLGVGSYQESAGAEQSRLEYSVADVNGNTITFGEWKKIDITVSSISSDFKQFGTHAARGVVAKDGTLLLPITLANFIKDSSGWGNSKWGYILVKGSYSSGNYTWNKVGSPVTMEINDGTKASRIVSGNSESDYVYVTVSDRGNPVKLFSGENGQKPTKSNIQAGDGAAGTLIVDKWVGGSYDPTAYANDGIISGAKSQAILSHVLELEKKLAIRLVDEKFKTQTSTGSFIPDESYVRNSKSSSLDMLKDGTIVLVAEGGQVAEGVQDGAQRPFFIHFYRYTQACIANKTK